MPVSSPLTVECRAVAVRMANITLTGGNANALRKLVYEDSVSLYNLMAKLLAMGNDAPDESGPGGYYSIATAQRRTSWAIEADGNLGLHPLLIASASDVVAACDFVDAPPAGGPREVGVTTAINRALKPLVMLDAASRPLDPAMVNGVAVRVEGSGWASLDGITFTIEVADVSLAQFYLVEGDTSAEAPGTGGGATIWLVP